ncbi:MAG: hypothetical protein GY801_01100, partial [bacterium]|nr:hypothetical protein [bacterium]
LNLESQVRLEELPWVAAIERFRQKSLSTGELTRQTLEEVVALTITSFPYTIIPNKLLQELRALSKGAELSLPLVDELAADIFMGEFSPKFLAAAKEAAELLGGTIYATYFGIDYADIRRISVKKRISGSWSQRITADRFGQLCASRAGVSVRWGNPATNGMIIEQQQILTSQNLAVLFKHLHLADVLHETLFELAQRSFTWICQRQQVKTDNWHARLITVKNTAYAWRQMVFYLAVLPKGQAPKFISWADDHLKAQNETFQRRFAPALRGLQVAAEGRTLDNKEVIKEGARRFLGWTTQKHWLLE